jgi:hypothetical protein
MNKLNATEIKNRFIAGNKLALKRLIERKKKENSFLVFSYNGKVIRINAKDINI